ncbi:MAG: integrin alpha, partial [Nitrospinota bacterium]
MGGILDQRFQFNGQEAIDELGSSVAAAGDVDGDGFADVIVGAPLANPGLHADAGSAFVFSGASGKRLLRLDGLLSGDALGSSVAGAGDVDGDGFADLIVGAPLADPNGNADSGSAFVFSGATGSLIWRFDGQGFHDELGFSVGGA